MENGSQNGPGKLRCSDLFGDLFATFSEGLLFDAFWSPLGSLWAPFWLPLAPFWHPLAHFWRPLAPFWLPFRFLFAPFGLHFLILVDFGSLLALFGSLSPTFSNLFNTFSEPICKKNVKLIHAFSLLQIFAYIYLCRPGADILPQATEIRPGPAPQPEAC